MNHPKSTRTFFVGLVVAYALLVAVTYQAPSDIAEMTSYSVIAPLLSIYAFHRFGVPGLLQHNGLCGWSWCEPTAFGWVFLGIFWTGVLWLVAVGLARLTTFARLR
jgi:hypothetical protein